MVIFGRKKELVEKTRVPTSSPPPPQRKELEWKVASIVPNETWGNLQQTAYYHLNSKHKYSTVSSIPADVIGKGSGTFNVPAGTICHIRGIWLSSFGCMQVKYHDKKWDDLLLFQVAGMKDIDSPNKVLLSGEEEGNRVIIRVLPKSLRWVLRGYWLLADDMTPHLIRVT